MTDPGDVVIYEREGPTAWITLNRPSARNALNLSVRSGLLKAIERFNVDDEAKVLVLTGAGSTFCAGGDLKEMAESGLRVPAPDYIPQIGRTIEVPKPTIAAVNGPAYAGGFLLAQCCDLCVASDQARFAISEIKVGRGAPWAAPLPWLIPPRVALELLLTGEPIGPQRALEVGLVNRVVAAERLRAVCQDLAETIAANAPLSVRAAKRTAYLAAEHPMSEALARAESIWTPVYESEDAQEGPAAFKERRQPAWKGR